MSAEIHPHAAPVGGRIWSPFTGSLAVLVAVMVGVLIVRFTSGLGAVSHMSNGYPWGIWIAFDVVIGSALGAGGFTVAFLTYILNRGEYHPIVRPALLTALFGYVQASLSVVLDVGRYWELWHMFWPKYAQVNSVLFEVAVCIGAYTTVLLIEFLPVVMERFGWERPRRKLDKLLFVFVAVGVLLPTMHQSSLGSLLIVFGPQVSPLYQTMLLPLLFLLSCVGMGLAAVVFEGTLSSLAFHRPLERELLAKLMGIGATLVAVFMVIRWVDLLSRGAWPLALQATPLAFMFWLENALFVASLVALASSTSRRRPQRLFVGASAMALAGILYRLDAYLVAYETGAGWVYFPSLGELAVTIGLVAFEILAFIIAVRTLPILPPREPRPSGLHPEK